MHEQKLALEVAVPTFFAAHAILGLIVGMALPGRFASATTAYFIGGFAFFLVQFAPTEWIGFAAYLLLSGVFLAHLSIFYFAGWFLGRHFRPPNNSSPSHS